MRRLGFIVLLCCLIAPEAQAQRAWQAPAELSADAVEAHAAVTGGGEVVTAWADRLPGPGAAAVLKARIGPHGPVVTLAERMGLLFDVAAAGDGSVVVTWLSDGADGALPHTMAAIRPPGGTFGEPADLGAAGWARPPAVAANANGDVVIALIREESYSPHLYAAHRPAGGAFGEPVPVATAEPVVHHDVAVGANGEAVFSWTQERANGQYAVHAASRLAIAPPATPVKLSGGANGGLSAVAVDAAGRAVVAWNERAQDLVGGPLRAAVRSAAGSWTPASGVSGWTMSAPDVATGAAGDAVIAWSGFTPSGPNGGQMDPVKLAAGRTDSGVFGAPRDFGVTDSSPSLAARADGSVLLAYGDTGGESHAARREGTGPFTAAQAVTCPARSARVEAAGIDDAGAATVLLHKHLNVDLPRPAWVTTDAAASVAGPASCAPVWRPPFLTFDPQTITVGKPVRIDAEGSREADFDPTRWRWDMDDDGVFEADTGTSPVHTHTWPTAGMKHFKLAVENRAGTAVYNQMAMVMPVPVAVQPPPVLLGAIAAPRGQRIGAVLKRGLRATASASQAGPVTVELWADAKEARRLKLARRAKRLGTMTVALHSNVKLPVTLRVSRAARRRLAKARRATLGIALLRDGKPLATVAVSLKR